MRVSFNKMRVVIASLLCFVAGEPYGSLSDLYEYDYGEGARENEIGTGKSTPQFLTQPQQLVVNAGSTARLPCLVDRLEGFVLLWRRDGDIVSVGNQIVDPSSPRVAVEEEEEGNTLVVRGVTQLDEASYTCSVSAFKKTEVKHSLTVRVEPVIETAPKSVLEVREGEAAVLACRLLAGSPTPSLHWRLPGGRTKEGPELVIPMVTRELGGSYRCEADNGFSALPVAQSLLLVVTYPPTVSVTHSPDSAKKMTLTCKVDAVPAADVTWWREGEQIGNRDEFLLGEDNLSVEVSPVLAPGSWGEYECKASNRLGHASATTSITGWADEASVTLSPLPSSTSSHQVDLRVSSEATVRGFRVQYGRSNSSQEAVARAEALPDGRWGGRVVLRGLLPDSRYWVRVATENSFGENNLGSRHWFRTISTTARQRSLSTAPTSVWTKSQSFEMVARLLIPTLLLSCLQ